MRFKHFLENSSLLIESSVLSMNDLVSILNHIKHQTKTSKLLRQGDCGVFAYALANIMKTAIGILVCHNNIEELMRIENIEDSSIQISMLDGLEADFAHVFIAEEYNGKFFYFDIDGILKESGLKSYAKTYDKPGIIFFFDHDTPRLDTLIRSNTNYTYEVAYWEQIISKTINSLKIKYLINNT